MLHIINLTFSIFRKHLFVHWHFIWKTEWQKERVIVCSFIHLPKTYNNQGWAKQKPRARDYILSFHMGGRGLSSWATFCLWSAWAGSWIRNGGRMWPSGSLNCGTTISNLMQSIKMMIMLIKWYIYSDVLIKWTLYVLT